MPTPKTCHASHDPLSLPALKGEVSRGKSMITGISQAQEIKSTSTTKVSDANCVVSHQEVSIVGGAVGGVAGGAGGAMVGRLVGGRTGGWVGGLVGSAVGGSMGSKGKKTYDCTVVVDNNGKQSLVRSITSKEIESGDTVQLYTLEDGTLHISSGK